MIRLVPLLFLVQVYITTLVAVDLLLLSYFWAGFFFIVGMINLRIIDLACHPKESKHDSLSK
jgi:hypothetical protein